MIFKDWKKDLFTIPNMLSVFRLLLIPVYVVIYLQATVPSDYIIAGSILAVSCLTDLIDGQIARRYNMISTFGKFLDPLADKVTQFTLTVCLAINYPILWILAGLLFVKEIFQLVAGIVFFRRGKILSGALMTGKICTTVLFISLIVMVLFPNIPEIAITWITIADMAFLLAAFVHYIVVYYKKTPMIEDLE